MMFGIAIDRRGRRYRAVPMLSGIGWVEAGRPSHQVFLNRPGGPHAYHLQVAAKGGCVCEAEALMRFSGGDPARYERVPCPQHSQGQKEGP